MRKTFCNMGEPTRMARTAPRRGKKRRRLTTQVSLSDDRRRPLRVRTNIQPGSFGCVVFLSFRHMAEVGGHAIRVFAHLVIRICESHPEADDHPM
jgi:hypothetical protein